VASLALERFDERLSIKCGHSTTIGKRSHTPNWRYKVLGGIHDQEALTSSEEIQAAVRANDPQASRLNATGKLTIVEKS